MNRRPEDRLPFRRRSRVQLELDARVVLVVEPGLDTHNLGVVVIGHAAERIENHFERIVDVAAARGAVDGQAHHLGPGQRPPAGGNRQLGRVLAYFRAADEMSTWGPTWRQ